MKKAEYLLSDSLASDACPVAQVTETETCTYTCTYTVFKE